MKTKEEIYREYSRDTLKWMKDHSCFTTKETTLALMEEYASQFKGHKCKCSPDETTGSVSVQCCNICGKTTEDWWDNGMD